MFGKKESLFDQDQNKQLEQLMKNQTILIKNNSYFINTIKVLTENNTYLINHVKSLETRMSANELKDQEQAALFANLSQSASQTKEEST